MQHIVLYVHVYNVVCLFVWIINYIGQMMAWLIVPRY